MQLHKLLLAGATVRATHLRSDALSHVGARILADPGGAAIGRFWFVDVVGVREIIRL